MRIILVALAAVLLAGCSSAAAANKSAAAAECRSFARADAGITADMAPDGTASEVSDAAVTGYARWHDSLSRASALYGGFASGPASAVRAHITRADTALAAMTLDAGVGGDDAEAPSDWRAARADLDAATALCRREAAG